MSESVLWYSDLEVSLKLRCEIPSNTHAVNVNVSLPVSKAVLGWVSMPSEALLNL